MPRVRAAPNRGSESDHAREDQVLEGRSVASFHIIIGSSSHHK